jgi:P pilus assembly chaperone PapD
MPTPRRTTKRTAKAAPAAVGGRKPPDETVELTGPPGHLSTTVTVENSTESRIAVRAPTLHLEGREPVPGSGAALIAPGATATVPVTLSLESSTPPGTYAAELEVSGMRRSAVVTVLAEVSMNVQPSTVLAAPGRQEVVLAVTNDGNVPVPLARRAIARTDDGGPDPGPDVALVLESDVTVEPGASLTLGGRLEVPRELDPARRHTATIPVGVADLEVIILPRSASERQS